MNGLTQLKTEIDFTLEELTCAIQTADEMNCETGGNWKELVEVADKLYKIRDELKNIFPESLLKAIKAQEEYEDEMSDKADAISF